MYQGDSNEPRDPFSDRAKNVMRSTKRRILGILRPILAALGAFFIIIGVPIAMMTPFPFVPIGLPIVILGTVLLARNSLAGRRWMQNTLKKHPSLERFAPHWLLKLIFGEDAEKAG